MTNPRSRWWLMAFQPFLSLRVIAGKVCEKALRDTSLSPGHYTYNRSISSDTLELRCEESGFQSRNSLLASMGDRRRAWRSDVAVFVKLAAIDLHLILISSWSAGAVAERPTYHARYVPRPDCLLLCVPLKEPSTQNQGRNLLPTGW